MAIETFQRQEIKFLLNEVQYQALTEQLEQYMNPDPYCVGGKDYGIYNIYYDTPDDYLIRTSLAKPYYKEKIRLRSYMSPAKPEDLVFLEIKKKIGGIVNKRRITLTLKEAEAYLQRGIHPVDNGKYVRRLVLEELDHFCDRYAPLVPKQYISYQRAAFFGKDDPNFRLTFDRQLTQRRTNLNLSSCEFIKSVFPSMELHTACIARRNSKQKKRGTCLMFNSVLSSVGLSVGAAATTDTTSFLSNTVTTATDAKTIVIILFLGVLVGLLISLLYIITHRKNGYSQSYVMTLLILPPIVAIVLSMINSTASALSLAGVFTLCRYRTIPGDPKDITYIFFAMAAGVLCGIEGAGHIWLIFLFYIVVAAVLLAVEFSGYGKCKTSSMTLKITIPEDMNYTGLFDEILNQNTTSWKLRRVKTTNFGSLFELVYSVEMKNTVDQKAFIDQIRTLNGNLTVVLTLFRYDDKVYETN